MHVNIISPKYQDRTTIIYDAAYRALHELNMLHADVAARTSANGKQAGDTPSPR